MQKNASQEVNISKKLKYQGKATKYQIKIKGQYLICSTQRPFSLSSFKILVLVWDLYGAPNKGLHSLESFVPRYSHITKF